MRLKAVATRGRKRRPITRRDWRRDWRCPRGKRRVWVGSHVRQRAGGPLFFALAAQQVKSSRASDWLGAAAMLLGVASWGVLAAVFGA